MRCSSELTSRLPKPVLLCPAQEHNVSRSVNRPEGHSTCCLRKASGNVGSDRARIEGRRKSEARRLGKRQSKNESLIMRQNILTHFKIQSRVSTYIWRVQMASSCLQKSSDSLFYPNNTVYCHINSYDRGWEQGMFGINWIILMINWI